MNSYQIGTKIYQANFSDDQITCSHYWFADLRDHDFSDRDLSNGEFIGCILDGANFEGASLDGARFAYCVVADLDNPPKLQAAQLQTAELYKNGFKVEGELQVDSYFAEATAYLLKKYTEPLEPHAAERLIFDYHHLELLGIMGQMCLRSFSRYAFDAVERIRILLRPIAESEEGFELGIKVLLLYLGSTESMEIEFREIIDTKKTEKDEWLEIWQPALLWIAKFPWQSGTFEESLAIKILGKYLRYYEPLIDKIPWTVWFESPESLPKEAWELMLPLINLGFRTIRYYEEYEAFFANALRPAIYFLIRSDNEDLRNFGLQIIDSTYLFFIEMRNDILLLATRSTEKEKKDLAYWLYFCSCVKQKEMKSLILDGKISEKYLEEISILDDYWYSEEEGISIVPVEEIRAGIESNNKDENLKALFWAAILPFPELKSTLMVLQELETDPNILAAVEKALSRQHPETEVNF